MFDLNPLEVLHKRTLTHLPPHFSKVKLNPNEAGFNGLESWIRTKLKGRYCISQLPAIDKDGHLKTATFVGFEDQRELTYFMLACPHLRRN